MDYDEYYMTRQEENDLEDKIEAANSRCPASAGSVIPLGTKIPNYGEVSGVTFRDGERYYFLTGGAVSLMPASVIEKIPLQNKPEA